MEALQSVLTPKQIAKARAAARPQTRPPLTSCPPAPQFILWTDTNPACMHMLNQLWNATTHTSGAAIASSSAHPSHSSSVASVSSSDAGTASGVFAAASAPTTQVSAAAAAAAAAARRCAPRPAPCETWKHCGGGKRWWRKKGLPRRSQGTPRRVGHWVPHGCFPAPPAAPRRRPPRRRSALHLPLSPSRRARCHRSSHLPAGPQSRSRPLCCPVPKLQLIRRHPPRPIRTYGRLCRRFPPRPRSTSRACSESGHLARTPTHGSCWSVPRPQPALPGQRGRHHAPGRPFGGGGPSQVRRPSRVHTARVRYPHVIALRDSPTQLCRKGGLRGVGLHGKGRMNGVRRARGPEVRLVPVARRLVTPHMPAPKGPPPI